MFNNVNIKKVDLQVVYVTCNAYVNVSSIDNIVLKDRKTIKTSCTYNM